MQTSPAWSHIQIHVYIDSFTFIEHCPFSELMLRQVYVAAAAVAKFSKDWVSRSEPYFVVVVIKKSWHYKFISIYVRYSRWNSFINIHTDVHSFYISSEYFIFIRIINKNKNHCCRKSVFNGNEKRRIRKNVYVFP